MSCPYRNLLGVPGEGVHSYRVFNIAIADVLLLVAFAWLVQKVFGISYALSLLISFLIGVILHRVFCVRTTIDRILFP
jgi:ABC-type enterochelin transport system permease subunit